MARLNVNRPLLLAKLEAMVHASPFVALPAVVAEQTAHAAQAVLAREEDSEGDGNESESESEESGGDEEGEDAL